MVILLIARFLEELMIGFPLGILYANALEWGLHRWVLHGLGRRKDSFFAFHFHEHHRAARKNEMHDAAYRRPVFEGPFPGSPQTREVLSLLGLGVVHAPLAWVAPWFSLGLVYSGINYYRVHRRAHLDPSWAREHLPWHVDHHMGADQDANWCVTRPWFDLIMKTRKVAPIAGAPHPVRKTRRDRAPFPQSPSGTDAAASPG